MLETKVCLALADQLSVLSVSDSIEVLLGFSAEDFIFARVSLKDLIHPDDSDISDTLFSFDTNNKSGAFNLRIRQANGRIRCIRGSYDKRSGSTENHVILDLLLQDAKSLKRTLDEAVSMPNFRAIMDNTDDYIYFKDRNHVFTGASQTLVSLCHPAERWTDLIGQTDYDVFPEEYADIYYRLEKQVFAGMPVAHEIQETLTNDGKKGWVDNRKYPINDDNGEIIGLYGIARDITERKIADEALRISESHYRSLFDNSLIGVAVTDKNYYFTDVNDAYCTLLGYTKEELIGKKRIADISYPDDAEKSIKMVEMLQSKRKDHYNLEKRYVTKTGEIITALLFVKGNYSKDGEFEGAIASVMDISSRIKAEEEKLLLEHQLLHAQKLESLGVLAGGVAHDFNNILMAIIGNADLALMRINKESPIVENLQRIEQAAARAADLAKQMLAYSGKGKFVVEHLNLNILLEEMLHILEVSISKKVVLRINPHQHLPSVEADATQMRQIIMNLAINASEAIGDKSGVIAITTGCMDCDRNYLKDVWLDENLTEGLYVYLEIADTGCGMDNTTMAKLFDPFFTTKFTGRGLGMAAVLGIVRGHKGAIKVYSELNKGTSFKILLPASDRPADLFNYDSYKDDWRGSGTVLLVDDEETVRGIGVEMLKELGFNPITAENGLEAVAVFKHNPDIRFVILDLTMPQMGGEQCFRVLKQIIPDVKVIISSGYNEQEVTQKFVGKGLAGFIQKPYKLSVLKEAIKKIS